MKFFGMIFIFSAFVMTGFYAGEKNTSALKDMESAHCFIKNILICLKNEHMTISKIFDFASNYGDDRTKNFIKQYKIDKSKNFCSSKEVNDIINEVFFVLGKYSIDDQLREIEFCREKLKNLYDSNIKKQTEKAKLCRRFGILFGFLSVILFF